VLGRKPSLKARVLELAAVIAVESPDRQPVGLSNLRMKPFKARKDLAFRAHEVREYGAGELIDENYDIASATKHRQDRHAHHISVDHVKREPSGARVGHAVRAVTGVDMRPGRLGRSAVPTRTRAFATSNFHTHPCASRGHALKNGVVDVVEPTVEQRLAYGFEAESRAVRVNEK